MDPRNWRTTGWNRGRRETWQWCQCFISEFRDFRSASSLEQVVAECNLWRGHPDWIGTGSFAFDRYPRLSYKNSPLAAQFMAGAGYSFASACFFCSWFDRKRKDWWRGGSP